MADIDRDEIITLHDEDGNDINFVVIDTVEYNGKNYLALIEEEHYDDEECEFTILRVDEQECNCEHTHQCEDECCRCEDECVLSTIEDENEFNEVMELLKEKLDEEDEYGFSDDEEDTEEEEEEEQ